MLVAFSIFFFLSSLKHNWTDFKLKMLGWTTLKVLSSPIQIWEIRTTVATSESKKEKFYRPDNKGGAHSNKKDSQGWWGWRHGVRVEHELFAFEL